MEQTTRKLITPAEAAAILGRSLQTVRKWVALRRLLPEKKLGRIYFDEAEIRKLALAAEVPPSRPKAKKGK